MSPAPPPRPSPPRTLAVLGCGNMGEAIVRGLAASPAAGGWRIVVFDPNDHRRNALADVPGVHWSTSAPEAAGAAQVILLAVKPQTMPRLLQEIAPADRALLVSIAAGITTTSIERALPRARVVRTMPNTPLLAGKGLVAFSPGASASAADLETARGLFPGASLLDVDENQMDAVTAVSGSGPAYFFAFVEALAAAAREQGFDADTAECLAAGTFKGAAALLEKSGASAADLRRRVTSPGGTTEAALGVLNERQFDAIIRAAVEAATRRGHELSGA